MHGGESAGPDGLKIQFWNRTRSGIVSTFDYCQIGIHTEGRVMEARTSATHQQQPQIAHHEWCLSHDIHECTL